MEVRCPLEVPVGLGADATSAVFRGDLGASA
jgi:hypothetical protein